MINTEINSYENLYYGMWEAAGRYSSLIQFRIIGKSHDDRMIPMIEMGQGDLCIFCLGGLSGRDRNMPWYLLKMIQEYAKYWECGWKLEELYDVRELLQKWKICFVPLLNPDGYEIYNKGFQAVRNPIYRQMLKMQGVPCTDFFCNGRGVDLKENFPTSYYRRKQIYQQPASENETKALVSVFQEYPGRGLLSFGYSEKRIIYFKQPGSFTTNQKCYRLARHMQKLGDFSVEKWKAAREMPSVQKESGTGSPEQFFSELCKNPAFRIEIPEREEYAEGESEREYREIHTLPLEFLFSL